MSIHPTAIIEDGAHLGRDCVIHAHAIITRHCILGDGVCVHPFAVLGGDPQDLHFDPRISTGLQVGNGTVVREGVTISRASKAGQSTRIGERCFLMATSHVAHDCELGDEVILANAALLAGHVAIGHRVVVGGAAGIHQFVRVGELTMISGASRVAQDVPPYSMAAERNTVIGLNLVGLKRRGLAASAITELKRAFQTVYRQRGNIRQLAAEALSSGQFASAEARRFLEFFSAGTRGFARTRDGDQAEAGMP
ncbi:MAG TPA: acyl-ACP--UDP-N-acetylglucosamine O-acyltransferase [Steroidobacteraceae bacterium]